MSKPLLESEYDANLASQAIALYAITRTMQIPPRRSAGDYSIDEIARQTTEEILKKFSPNSLSNEQAYELRELIRNLLLDFEHTVRTS